MALILPSHRLGQPARLKAPALPHAAHLLAWYDRHARSLPWRVPPGSGLTADPYKVWLSEVMLQQTTVAAVKAYFQRFTTLWPTVHHLADAPDATVMAEWAGLGYYARARNLLACARAVSALGGFPQTAESLQMLPGIGPYTAAAIAAIAFNQPATVVDGNVERVVARLFAVTAPLPGSRKDIVQHTASITPAQRPGDFAQAMMDLGATLCTPRAPDCAACPLNPHCAAFRQGIAASLPAKLAKPAKPTRTGTVWILRNAADQYLCVFRPPKGLLGGMVAFPSTGWDGTDTQPPLTLPWVHRGQVRHSFTHFHLDLTVLSAQAPQGANPAYGAFEPLDPAALPTLMRKAFALA